MQNGTTLEDQPQPTEGTLSVGVGDGHVILSFPQSTRIVRLPPAAAAAIIGGMVQALADLAQKQEPAIAIAGADEMPGRSS